MDRVSFVHDILQEGVRPRKGIALPIPFGSISITKMQLSLSTTEQPERGQLLASREAADFVWFLSYWQS